MSKMLKAAAAAVLIVSGTSMVLAQGQTTNPTGDPRPLSPGASEPQQPNMKKEAPTNPTPQTSPGGVGSRPIGPPTGADQTTTTPSGTQQKKSPN